MNSWNNHPIQTAHHKCPQHLFTAGALCLQHSGLLALDFCDNVDNDYGVDPNEPIATDNDDCNGITIPQTTLKFSEADDTLLQQTVGPLTSLDNYGIDLYEQALVLITTFTLI